MSEKKKIKQNKFFKKNKSYRKKDEKDEDVLFVTASITFEILCPFFGV